MKTFTHGLNTIRHLHTFMLDLNPILHIKYVSINIHAQFDFKRTYQVAISLFSSSGAAFSISTTTVWHG